jgi:hypothetical protein
MFSTDLSPLRLLTKPQLVFNLRGWNPRPVFLVEPEWIPRIFSLSMTPHWQGVDFGDRVEDLQGISYLLMPAPAAHVSYSAHFDPDSPYFFSFFGLYVIPPVQGRRVTPEIFAELGNRDNLAWLKSMGDPQPYSQPIVPLLAELNQPAEATSPKWSFLVNYQLHSGLGSQNPRANFPEVLLPPIGTLPNSWGEKVDSYQDVVMTCRGFLWYEGDYLVINFFNGVEFTNKSGKTINTYNDYPEFREQLLRMADGIRILNDGRGFVSPDSGTLSHW